MARRFGNNSNQQKKSNSSWINDSRLTSLNFGEFSDILNRGFSVKNIKRHDFDKKNDDKYEESTKEKTVKNAEEKETLKKFVDDIVNNKTDGLAIKEIIEDQIIDVCKVMVGYYENKFSNIVDVMNECITVMTTNRFTESLLTAFSNSDFWEDDKRVIAKTMSVVLQTSADKMSETAQSNYIEIITEHIYPGEIAELTDGTGLYEDAVIDLFITIPDFGNKMSMGCINATYGNFASTIIRYYDELSEYADAAFIKDLFYKIYPDIEGQSIKVVGKCLSALEPSFRGTDDQLEVMTAVFEEYVKALYEILDDNDINDIKNTLVYIATVLEKNGKKMDDIIFNIEDAWEYPNIRKAYFQLSRSNNSKCEKYFR